MKILLVTLLKKVTNALSDKDLWKIPGIVFLYEFILKTVKPKKGIFLITCQGIKIYVNAKDEGIAHFLLAEGVYEKHETELFKKLIKPGMIVADIGANIGYFTLIAAKLVGNDGRIYAFEPEPYNFELLAKNIEINGYTNIIPIQKAISNKHGKITLFLDNSNLGNPSFSEDNIPNNAGFIEVETITLDDFFENAIKDTKVDLIKMDVQGAEGLIIEGAGKILKRNDLKIIMEFWPYGLKNIGTDPLELLQKLLEYSFRIRLIDEANLRIRHIEIMRIIERCENIKNGKGFVSLLLEKN